MIKKTLQSGIIFTIGALFVVLIFVSLFDTSGYNDEEINWCNTYRPALPIEICAREFGY